MKGCTYREEELNGMEAATSAGTANFICDESVATGARAEAPELSVATGARAEAPGLSVAREKAGAGLSVAREKAGAVPAQSVRRNENQR